MPTTVWVPCACRQSISVLTPQEAATSSRLRKACSAKVGERRASGAARWARANGHDSGARHRPAGIPCPRWRLRRSATARTHAVVRGSPGRGVGDALKIGRVVRELLGNGGAAGRTGTIEGVGQVNVSAGQGGFRGRGRTRPTELRNATDEKPSMPLRTLRSALIAADEVTPGPVPRGRHAQRSGSSGRRVDATTAAARRRFVRSCRR